MQTMTTFTKGPLYRPLVKFAIPVFIAMFLQASYGAVDLLVVGRYGDASDVSAVSMGAMVMQTLTFVLSDIAMGSTIIIGQRIGEGKTKEVVHVIGVTIALFAVLAVVATAVMEPFAGVITTLLKTPAQASGKATTYVRVCCAGMIFIVAFNIIGSVFRGMGNSDMPLFAVLVATVCNIAGDLWFVAGLRMGVKGAAIATVLSQMISVAVSLCFCHRHPFSVAVKTKDIRLDRRMCRTIFGLGLPIAFQDLLVSISFLVIAAIINQLGLIASAGVGIAEKVCAFLMLVPSSFMQSISAIVAQNIGAGEKGRADKTLWYGIMTSLAAGVCMFYLAFFHGKQLSLLFTTSQEVASASADYLKAYGIDCILTSFLFCFIGYFNGMGLTKFVMTQGIIGAFGVRIPVSSMTSRRVGATLFQVGLATPCSTLLQILLCLWRFFTLRKKQTD